MGTNSTRLLVADVEGGQVDALCRESRVTRLGRGVETSGRLATEGIEEVCGAVGDYVEPIGRLAAETTVALATSAVRDAANGDAFLAELRERFSLHGQVIDGLEEARLTYRGALSNGGPDGETLVVDIGGGSTELILGSGEDPAFRASMQVGVVRHSERHVHADPPQTSELEALSDDIGAALEAELASHPGLSADHAIAVAGTPTSLAAMELELERPEADDVEGHTLRLPAIQQACSRLASLTLEERRRVVGLHPDRAPTIVAGVVILIKTMRAFGLTEIDVSERDILYGAALAAAENGGALSP